MSSTPQFEALQKIKSQSKDTDPTQVYVIELESIPFKEITLEMRSLLENFTSLQYLAFNNCELESLTNFPGIRSLIRLDLISNKLTGDSLDSILTSRYLQTLYLSANQIEHVDELKPLKTLKNLLQLDIVANEVTRQGDYQKKVFELLPNLKVLDSTNVDGTSSDVISESLKRIRPDLFIKGKSKENLGDGGVTGAIFNKSVSVPKKAKSVEKKAKKEEKMLVLKTKPKKEKPKPKISKSQNNSLSLGKGKISGGKSLGLQPKKQNSSTKAGLVFKASRIGRRLKGSKMFERVSKTAPIYLTAVLEYVCAEILEVAKDNAINEKKKRIMPKHIKFGIDNDPDLKIMFKDMIIPEGGNEQNNSHNL